MGMTAVRNSTHYGIAGYYALMATRAGMIGITGTNARPSIAPTLGVENMLGTNPLTIGLPTDEAFPFILDCATSVSQRGKIESYARMGKSPAVRAGSSTWRAATAPTPARSSSTSPRTGPRSPPWAAWARLGAGYKGYGYATVVEVLCAALQDGAYLKMLNGFDEQGRKIPYPLGHFFLAIDVAEFIELDRFKEIAGNIMRDLRASRKAPGEERIYTGRGKGTSCLGIPPGPAAARCPRRCGRTWKPCAPGTAWTTASPGTSVRGSARGGLRLAWGSVRVRRPTGA